MYLFFPIMMFGMIVTQMGQASASAERIFEILDAKSDIVDKPGASKLPEVQGDVRFENVTFRYFGGGEPVLNNVSFDAKPGETIALLGATGSGKTTIINLLPRFYDPSEGRITIDGYDLRDVTPTLRSNRYRFAGNDFIQRHDPREHRVRETRCDARRNPERRQSRGCA
jgi:ATP-binding cassette subfamily B protein